MIVTNWLKEIEDIFKISECSRRQRVTYASYLLKGEARHWWNMIKITHSDDVATGIRGPVQQARPTTFEEAVKLALMVEKENNRQLEEGGDNKRKRENCDDDMKKIKISGEKKKNVNKARAMSSASSTVTYTSVYTGSEPGRPVAPPSPDYISGPEEPQTPPVPQDEDEREPMFIQPQDPDYVPEPIYPEHIPLEDEHVFPVEEQPLPPVDSPTAESPGYVTESDPEED
ncbi:hypothetical protein Tco_0550701 [Tanacetum coccineum]